MVPTETTIVSAPRATSRVARMCGSRSRPSRTRLLATNIGACQKAHGSDTRVIKGGTRANAKGSLNLMTSGTTREDEIIIRAEGEDEAVAARAPAERLSKVQPDRSGRRAHRAGRQATPR
jgi:phosphotransferase system HPr-like phosphotransfer protein